MAVAQKDGIARQRSMSAGDLPRLDTASAVARCRLRYAASGASCLFCLCPKIYMPFFLGENFIFFSFPTTRTGSKIWGVTARENAGTHNLRTAEFSALVLLFLHT